MKIIVGLGNIGEKYKNTRHNCGFLVIDELKKEIEKENNTKLEWEENQKLKALIIKTKYKQTEILLVKPTTLMNLSGESVAKILNFFKESAENLIIIYDDIDLPLGKIRIREKGSAGTHNGIRSVIQAINSENFKRIRIGIESRGDSTPSQQEITDFVLSDFKGEEKNKIKKALLEAIVELKKFI